MSQFAAGGSAAGHAPLVYDAGGAVALSSPAALGSPEAYSSASAAYLAHAQGYDAVGLTSSPYDVSASHMVAASYSSPHAPRTLLDLSNVELSSPHSGVGGGLQSPHAARGTVGFARYGDGLLVPTSLEVGADGEYKAEYDYSALGLDASGQLLLDASAAAAAGGAAAGAVAEAAAGAILDPNDPTVDSTTEYLSSYAIPNAKDAANDSPLPMGILLSPCVRLSPPAPVLAAPAALCEQCGALLNLYCRVIQRQTHSQVDHWRCCFCKHDNAFSSDGGGGGRRQDVPYQLRPELAKKVYEYVDDDEAMTGLGGSSWDADAASQFLAASAAKASAAAARAESKAPAVSGGLYMFVVDANSSKQAFKDLRKALSTLCRELPRGARVGLLTFSNTVELYDLGQAGLAAANVISGEASPSVDDVDFLLDNGRIEGMAPVVSCTDALLDCLDALAGGSEPLADVKSGKDKNESKGEAAGAAARQDRLMSPRCLGAAVEVALFIMAGYLKHAGGAAKSIRPQLPCRAHVVVCTSGPPDFGPGATAAAAADSGLLDSSSDLGGLGGGSAGGAGARAAIGAGAEAAAAAQLHKASCAYYGELSRRAHGMTATVDLFCGGLGSFAVPVVRQLVQHCGGHIYLYPTFGDDFAKDLKTSLFRAIGVRGTLTIRMLSSLSISRVIGGVTEIKEKADVDEKSAAGSSGGSGDGKSAAAAAGGKPRKAPQHESVTVLALDMASLRPDESVTLYYRLEEDIPEDYVYFQFSLAFTNFAGQRVHRVMTRRVRTTGSAQTFVRSMDVNVIAILLARRSVLLASKRASGQSGEGGSGDLIKALGMGLGWSGHAFSSSKGDQSLDVIHRDLDEQIREIAERFGRKEMVRLGGKFVQSVEGHWVMPPELAQLPKLVFHLRRGPLLGPILQHPDDIDASRALFLSASRGDAVRMLLPTLLSFNSTGDFEQLPLETLALQSNRILYLDHQTHIFVWSGRDVAGKEFDAFRDACRERAAQASALRVPSPQVMVFTEGSSQSRWLVCRLVPTHKDPDWVQETSFAQLLHMTPAQRADLLSKFLDTDEPSYYEYSNAIFKV